uniref:HELICc2 domain-containing protein n=1 Tax=Macrostomum lignano TaxID=282301 RepID=A0A1I8FQJ6_9PLAT
EQVCEDGASVELSSVDLAQCIFEIDAAVSGFNEEDHSGPAGEQPQLEDLSGAEAQESLDFTVSDLGDSAGPGFTKPGAYVLELLAQADITAPRVAHIEFIAGVFPQSSYCDPAVSSASGSSSSSSGSSTQRRRGLPSSSSGLAQCYKLHIREVSGGHYGRSGATSAPAATVGFDTDASAAASSGPAGSGKPYRLLSYWCFSPAKAMLDLAAHGVRSIILTSGTLYPMEALRQDLQLPFPIELSNPPRDRSGSDNHSCGGRAAPNSVRLSSGYENRDSLDYQRALGECVASLCGCVPHGLLVFFPSYSLMSRCLDAWRSSRLFDRISSRKPVGIRHGAFADYYKRVCDPQYAGAIFLAVCRGKVSEGLDFADHFRPAVVVTGLPYPMWTDPRVRLKQAWLDEQRLATGRGLTGKQWYKQQALPRSHYQAIRCAYSATETTTRAVLLCDERSASPPQESGASLPAWLQHSVTVAKTFESVPDRLREFFASNSRQISDRGWAENAPAGQATKQMQFDGQSARPRFEFGLLPQTHQLKAQAGAGPVYGSSVSPLIGGGRAGTVIEFLRTATEEMAQNSVQTPSDGRLLQGRGRRCRPFEARRLPDGVRRRVSSRRRCQARRRFQSAARCAAQILGDAANLRLRREILAVTIRRRRRRRQKPTPASPSNPFSKPSPPSPDLSAKANGADSGRPLAEYKSSAELTVCLAGWPRFSKPPLGVASAGWSRGEPAAVRQLLFGLGRLNPDAGQGPYEQCRERLAEAALMGWPRRSPPSREAARVSSNGPRCKLVVRRRSACAKLTQRDGEAIRQRQLRRRPKPMIASAAAWSLWPTAPPASRMRADAGQMDYIMFSHGVLAALRSRSLHGQAVGVM